jgi:hypothetical protein
VPSFAETVRPLQNMIKKDVVFKWNNNERESFKAIKEAIVQSPSLSSPNFSKDFTLYTFASDFSCVFILTQKMIKILKSYFFYEYRFSGCRIELFRSRKTCHMQYSRLSNTLGLFS